MNRLLRGLGLIGVCLMSLSAMAQTVAWKKIYQQPHAAPIKLITPEAQTLVLIFLAPECPLCLSYAPTLKQLYQQFYDQGKVRFIGVFPGTRYSTAEQQNYLSETSLPFPCITDPDFTLTREVKASITPEVVVANAQGNILYQGRIDNWAYALGKKRPKITSHDLRDVLQKRAAGLTFAVKKTVPVGCIIE